MKTVIHNDDPSINWMRLPDDVDTYTIKFIADETKWNGGSNSLRITLKAFARNTDRGKWLRATALNSNGMTVAKWLDSLPADMPLPNYARKPHNWLAWMVARGIVDLVRE